MKKLWSSKVRGTKLENFRTWCENSTVHGCEISHQFMGANFRTTVHGCEIFAPVCKNFQFVSLTLDEHNFFVRTPFEVFLDFMESSLSQESRFLPMEDKWGSKPF